MEAAELYKKSKREAISELLHEIEYVLKQIQILSDCSIKTQWSFQLFTQRLRDVTTSVPSYKDLMAVMMTR